MLTHAYVDQNFLSKCADNPAWEEQVLRAVREGKLRFVLAPFHLYEFGKTEPDERREKIMTLLEKIGPLQVPERADLLTAEFLSTWRRFFGDNCSLPEHIPDFWERHNASGWREVTLRQCVNQFISAENRKPLTNTFAEGAATFSKNGEDYQQGRIDEGLMRKVNRRHIACQFAYLEGLTRPEEVLARSEYLLETEPFKAMVEEFMQRGGMTELRTWRIACYFSELIHRRKGGLSRNSFVDREHAIVGMSCCELFVTGDKALRSRCKQMRTELGIPLASVLFCEEFISYLKLE